jgi:Ca2+-transporting ATPase
VAREASSIVLLDDDFGSIVTAVRLGRRIYDNIRKAMGFIFAVHVPIAGLALLPLIFGLPILFGPIHIAFLEMVIDPVCSLVFEAETEEADVMGRSPRAPTERLLSRSLIAWGLLQGACALGLVTAVVLLASSRQMSDEEVRALAFFSLVMTIVSLIFVNRSFSPSPFAALNRPNPALALVLLAVAVMLGLSVVWPFARTLFGFGPLHLDDLALTLGAGIVLLAVLELFKLFFARADARTRARG